MDSSGQNFRVLLWAGDRSNAWYFLMADHVAATRIVLDDEPLALARQIDRPVVRYALAIGIVLLPLLAIYLNGDMRVDLHLTLLFGAILLGSAIAGGLPGLAATAVLVIVEAAFPMLRNNSISLWLLAVDGVLLSAFGGALWHSRRKARARQQANLQLEKQVLEIGDDERRRIGHDLHDGLGQHLTGISLLTETISLQLREKAPLNVETVETITQLVSQAVGITRDLATNLSPVTLEQDGLVMALQELAETSATLLGIECTFSSDASVVEAVDHVRALHLYRIIQEAVNNSVRHGKATKVGIILRRDGPMLQAEVIDNGSGLSIKTSRNPGLGLRIMKYRARILGASLSAARASEAGGTVVTCRWPLKGPPIPA